MRTKTALVLSVLVALALSLFPGCGKKSQGVVEGDAMEVLRQTSQAMAQVRTYRLKGTMSMSAAGLTGAGADTWNMEMESELENRDGDVRQHMSMSVSGVSMDAYLVGGVYYQNVPGQGWMKMSVAEYRTQNMNLGMMDPDQMGLLADSAQELKIIGEDEDSVGISFQLGKEFLLASIDFYRKNVEGGGQQMQEGLEMLEKAAEDFSASVTMWIRKADHYMKSMEMSYRFGDFAGMGSVDTSINAEYSDYNADIRVELPEEARQAKEFDYSSI